MTVRTASPAELAIAEALASAHARRGTAIDEAASALRAWFAEEERRAVEALRAALRAQLPQAAVELQTIAESAWGETWREHFRTQRIGRIAVVPPWERAGYRDQARVVVEIDPGQAFGTGLHPTTRRCLLALQTLTLEGCSLTDVGTGSGILAIAAARLGAAPVYACDVDPVAVRAARENVRRNGLETAVRVAACGEDLGDVPAADVVVANLTAAIIAPLAARLRALLREGGLLLLAGVVREREALVSDALAASTLRVVDRQTDGEWVTLTACAERTTP
ncbi:MAG: 50S ribosomal protein L11 methyltransferase [bacterium]|nr:50S ribosomal protein L11 methyltransferase [bacterium]